MEYFETPYFSMVIMEYFENALVPNYRWDGNVLIVPAPPSCISETALEKALLTLADRYAGRT
jgi:hypothetical protein